MIKKYAGKLNREEAVEAKKLLRQEINEVTLPGYPDASKGTWSFDA